MGRQKKVLDYPLEKNFFPCCLSQVGFFYDNELYQQALPDMWEEMADLQSNVRIGGMNS